MNRLFLLLFFIIMPLIGFGQTKTSNVIIQDTVNDYKLYPTKNMWTFLKLNTSNGQIWQVHFSINDKGNDGEYCLNILKLAHGNDAINGRFELYPTENLYNFILLDKVDGRTWQVQWSFDYSNRGILPIKNY